MDPRRTTFRSRAVLGVAVAVLLAGCTAAAGPTELEPHDPAPPPEYLDEGSPVFLGSVAGADAEVLGVADGGEDRAVVLLAPAGGDPLRLAAVRADGELRTVELPDLDPAYLSLTSIHPATDGRVVVVGVHDGDLAVTVVDEDGETLTAPVHADLTPANVISLLATTSTYGDLIHLVVSSPDGTSRLLTVVTHDGDVVDETPLAFGIPGRVQPRAVTASAMGEHVVVSADLETGEPVRMPVIGHYDAGLRLADEAPLAPERVPASAGPIALDGDDVFATVVKDEPGGGIDVFFLQSGRNTPTPVASLPVPADVRTLAYGTNETLYIGGPAPTGALTWTVVNSETGERISETILCATGRYGGADVDRATTQGWLAGRCGDGGPEEPVVWRLT